LSDAGPDGGPHEGPRIIQPSMPRTCQDSLGIMLRQSCDDPAKEAPASLVRRYAFNLRSLARRASLMRTATRLVLMRPRRGNRRRPAKRPHLRQPQHIRRLSEMGGTSMESSLSGCRTPGFQGQGARRSISRPRHPAQSDMLDRTDRFRRLQERQWRLEHKLGRPNGATKQKSLRHLATGCAQEQELLRSLDPFCRCRNVKVPPETSDRANNCGTDVLAGDISRERLVDFNLIEWKHLKIFHGGISDSKIVQYDGNPEALDFVQHSQITFIRFQ
jgi:hypothetical protein